MKVNLKAEDYYTQRNNPTVIGNNGFQLYSHSQCMNTSYVMFLLGNNISYKNPTDLPDDAYFGKLLISDDAYAFAHKKYPWSIKSHTPPVEIHGMYGSYLSPIICGRRVSDFKTDLTFKDIMNKLSNNEIIMTSGKFPDANIYGHAFDIIGYNNNKLLLADPWGDFRTDYKSYSGYGVIMDDQEFKIHVKPDPVFKWGHVKV